MCCSIKTQYILYLEKHKTNLKYQFWHRMKSLNYLVDHILYQGYFDYIIKKHETFTDNLSIRIHINKMENRMAFKIKKGYYLQLLTPEKMKLQRSTENNKVGTKGL